MALGYTLMITFAKGIFFSNFKFKVSVEFLYFVAFQVEAAVLIDDAIVLLKLNGKDLPLVRMLFVAAHVVAVHGGLALAIRVIASLHSLDDRVAKQVVL